jgi:predicted nucleic acid-binding Zn ribbon protein
VTVSKLPEHGHCENCGDPTPFGEHFCSDACAGEYANDVKEAKRLDNRFYLIMVGILAGIAVAVIAVKAFIL